MAETYDLIIVGAGPAGAAAALYAHRHGLQTLLVDKESFPRDKVCGDALSGKSVAVLHELGLMEEVRRLPGAAIRRITFGSPQGTCADIDLGGFPLHNRLTGQTLAMEGFVIRRQVFDHFLFARARARVARCLEGFAIRDLVRCNGRVCGVRGRGADGQEAEFAAPLVLGCDGFNSLVARKAGLYAHQSRHWMVALRCYYERVSGLSDQIELHFIDPVRPGYFWIFPLEDGRANVGIGMDYQDIKKRGVNLKQALRQAIASPAFGERFARARPLEEPVGWNLPVGSCRRTVHADGLLLLGDAAGLIDPFTGEGIGNALYSARLAAEVAIQAKQAGDYSAAFLKQYEDRLWQALGPELRTSTRLHQLSRRRFLMNLVIRKAATNAAVGELIGGMMANAVPRQKLTNPLFYLGLLFK